MPPMYRIIVTDQDVVPMHDGHCDRRFVSNTESMHPSRGSGGHGRPIYRDIPRPARDSSLRGYPLIVDEECLESVE